MGAFCCPRSMTMVALQRSGSTGCKAYVKTRVVACICNVHVQSTDLGTSASIDLLRVNTRGLACSGAWHCAAAGGPSHERHQKKTLGAYPTPEDHEAKISGSREKGLSKLLRLITLSCSSVFATSPAHRGRAADEIEITLSRSRAPSPACFSFSDM